MGMTETSRWKIVPCPKCVGGIVTSPNPAYYRKMRKDAKLTLVEMGKICGVDWSYLAYMERGKFPFLRKYADMYDRLLKRIDRAGEE